jgi:hypothetical protein
MADILTVRDKIMAAHDEASEVAGVLKVSEQIVQLTAERDAAVTAKNVADVAVATLQNKISSANAALTTLINALA